MRGEGVLTAPTHTPFEFPCTKRSKQNYNTSENETHVFEVEIDYCFVAGFTSHTQFIKY